MESVARSGCAASCHAGNVQSAARETDPEGDQEGDNDGRGVQQERDAESMEDIFTLRQRLAIMAAGAIAVVVTGYSLWRHLQISAELEQVSAGADLLQRKLAKLSGEHDKNLGQLASQGEENAWLKAENTKLRSERDHWQRAAQEARALAAAKQYSVEELRKILGSDGGKDA